MHGGVEAWKASPQVRYLLSFTDEIQHECETTRTGSVVYMFIKRAEAEEDLIDFAQIKIEERQDELYGEKDHPVSRFSEPLLTIPQRQG